MVVGSAPGKRTDREIADAPVERVTTNNVGRKVTPVIASYNLNRLGRVALEAVVCFGMRAMRP